MPKQLKILFVAVGLFLLYGIVSYFVSMSKTEQYQGIVEYIDIDEKGYPSVKLKNSKSTHNLYFLSHKEIKVGDSIVRMGNTVDLYRSGQHIGSYSTAFSE